MGNALLSGGRMIALLFAVFFALLGFGALYLQGANDENAERLASQGVTSLATITDKHTTTSHNTNRKASGMKRYVLKYTFPLAGSGKQWQGDDDVSESDYNSVKIGDQFDVRYWPQDPEIATIIEDAYGQGAELLQTIATVLFSLAALMALIWLSGPLRRAFGKKEA